VSLANYIDTVIDYPNAKIYAFMLLDKLVELKIVAPDMIDKYKKHVENLQSDDQDY